MTVVVDTPVWSLALRRRPGTLTTDEQTIVMKLATLLRGDEAVVLGVVRQEVLSGVTNDTHFEQVRQHFRGWIDQPTLIDDYETAARFANVCRKAGISGSLVDFLICALAVRLSARIFTLDADFVRYATALPIRLL